MYDTTNGYYDPETQGILVYDDDACVHLFDNINKNKIRKTHKHSYEHVNSFKHLTL